MGGAEGIVDVAVGIAGELFHELFLAGLHGSLGGLLLLVGGVLGEAAGFAFFLSVVTQVLQEEDLAGLQGIGLGLSLLAVIGELDGNAQALAHAGHDVLEGELGIYLLGTAQVRHDDEGTTFGEHLLEGGHGTADTGVIGDFEILVQGNVEVYAYDGFLAFEVVLVNELLHKLYVCVKTFEPTKLAIFDRFSKKGFPWQYSPFLRIFVKRCPPML